MDFILVSRDSMAFHEENLNLNFKHYSTLRWLKAKNLASLQMNCAARIYFNTRVQSKNRLIKYGVIGVRDFLQYFLIIRLTN